MNAILNRHHTRALTAFQNAVQGAEEKLSSVSTTNAIDKAKVLIDLAELHLLANETSKAEVSLTEALNSFYASNDYDVRESLIYVAYILKTLSGIHTCKGRTKEAKDEYADALIWEGELEKLNMMDKESYTLDPKQIRRPVKIIRSSFMGITFA